MSYILDALRRADAERERGQVPGIHAQPTRITPTPGAIARPAASRWLPAAWALPVLLLLAWLTWRVTGSDAGPQATTPGGAVTAPAAEPATPAPTPVSPTSPVLSMPGLPLPVAPTGESSVPTEVPGRAPARNVAATAPVKKTLAAASSTGVRSSAPRSALPAASSAVPENAGAAPAKVYALDELPDEVRRELPKLAIGGSTFSESSASRFLIVNGQLCHEGDTLAPGLVLQQIKPRSAVLGFRGYRYTIGL